MIDKIWWYFEDFIEWFMRLSKKAYRPKPGDEDRGIAITRDGKVYYGKYYLDHPDEIPQSDNRRD